jgi:hypothetical protein
VSKKLQQKQDRRRAEEARKAAQRRAHRRSNLLTIGVAVVVGALVVGGIIYQRSTGEGGVSDEVGVSEAAANCTGVREPEKQPADHIAPGEPHPPYSSDPPTSGPHLEQPANPGFYDQPLPAEQVIHNMEHGQIVIWYAPDAPEEVVGNIESLVRQESTATLAVPYEAVGNTHTFVMTAWGASQACEQVSQAVVNKFRTEYQGRGPERVPGIPTFDG